MNIVRTCALGLLFLLPLGFANASTLRFRALLTGAQEVPAVETKARGLVTATVDTGSGAFNYRVVYSGLSGAPTAAEFDGPAAAGSAGAPTVSITHPKSPIRGRAMLLDGQIGDLMADMWYFNVHTAARPDGEIRGQLTPPT